MPFPPQNSEELARKGHLMGMKPMVLVNFISSVNFYVWKLENLQILMEAAPMRSTGRPNCLMVVGGGWLFPECPEAHLGLWQSLEYLLPLCLLHPAGYCPAEAMCILNWYTPMPIKNGSVVSEVDIYTNGIGPFIPKKRCCFWWCAHSGERPCPESQRKQGKPKGGGARSWAGA